METKNLGDEKALKHQLIEMRSVWATPSLSRDEAFAIKKPKEG